MHPRDPVYAFPTCEENLYPKTQGSALRQGSSHVFRGAGGVHNCAFSAGHRLSFVAGHVELSVAGYSRGRVTSCIYVPSRFPLTLGVLPRVPYPLFQGQFQSMWANAGEVQCQCIAGAHHSWDFNTVGLEPIIWLYRVFGCQASYHCSNFLKGDKEQIF